MCQKVFNSGMFSTYLFFSPVGVVLRCSVCFDAISGNIRGLRINWSENGRIWSSWRGTRRVPGANQGMNLQRRNTARNTACSKTCSNEHGVFGIEHDVS